MMGENGERISQKNDGKEGKIMGDERLKRGENDLELS